MLSTRELINKINNGEYDNLFKEIYVEKSLIGQQKQRYINAIEKYQNIFGEDEVNVFSAPGRSEIAGNHTDHQQGEVLVAAINLDAIAITKKRDDNIVKILSEGYKEIEIDVRDLSNKSEEKETTIALVKGILASTREKGYQIGGFNAYITSDVLIGAGLSSSAAFEILIVTILSHLFNEDKIDDITRASIGQNAENTYFGKPCGLMDQMACSVGNLVYVNFKNIENPVVQKVDFDINKHGYSLCITDTLGSHSTLTSEYAAVPKEMKEVANFFGKEVLEGISYEEIINNISCLREKCGDRAVLRAIHFITENERVKQEVNALREDNIEKFIKLVKASGDSSYKYLQNVYLCSDIRHQNLSVALAISDIILGNENGACRVHGGGFAGTIQAFVKNNVLEEYVSNMNKVFGEGACKILKIRKFGGIKVLG